MEMAFFGTKRLLEQCMNDAVWISGSRIYRNPEAKYLGVILDEHLLMKSQITKVCARAKLNIAWICCLCPYLTEETSKILVQALVLSHMDYTNPCYAGLPKREIDWLQHVQNQAAKLILKAKCRDSTTQCLKDLHWLPCQQRIQYKILKMVFKCLHEQALEYLCELFQPLVVHSSRHGGLALLSVPFTKYSKYADRTFSVQGLHLWNTLLTPEIHAQPSLDSFKTHLKTHLCTLAYNVS